MSEQGSRPPESGLLSPVEIARLWAKFRAGDVVLCPYDQHGVALAVDGAAKAYRLVCTKCGRASPWFGTTAAGLVFHSTATTMDPGAIV
jgi:hypothetical protein